MAIRTDPYTEVFLLFIQEYVSSWNLYEISKSLWNFWSTNFHKSVSLLNFCSIFKEEKN